MARTPNSRQRACLWGRYFIRSAAGDDDGIVNDFEPSERHDHSFGFGEFLLVGVES